MLKPKKKLPDFFINAFYESKFRDNLFIIKASGSVIEDEQARDNLIDNIRELTLQGIKVILIYGGGNAMDEVSQERGIEVEKIHGRRINKQENIDVLKHVVGGDLSLSISSAMKKHNLNGLSFNAIPGNWAEIVIAPKTKEDSFTGDLKQVYSRPINRLFKGTSFISIPCIGIAEDGTICNINADTVSYAIASGLKADKLVFMSNVDGVKVDGKTALMLTENDIPELIEKNIVTDGMRVKMENCLKALSSGVKRIHLINGLREHALRSEIFESVGPGTMILREEEKDSYMNEVNIHKAIGGK